MEAMVFRTINLPKWFTIQAVVRFTISEYEYEMIVSKLEIIIYMSK